MVEGEGEGKASLPSQRASPNQSWPMTPTDTNSPSPLSLEAFFSPLLLSHSSKRDRGWGVGWLDGYAREMELTIDSHLQCDHLEQGA